MTEDEIQRLADLLFDKIMEQQEQADIEYAEQIQKLFTCTYVLCIFASPLPSFPHIYS